eukprot:6285821-Alexandrium_andersonii.AAC.1
MQHFLTGNTTKAANYELAAKAFGSAQNRGASRASESASENGMARIAASLRESKGPDGEALEVGKVETG